MFDEIQNEIDLTIFKMPKRQFNQIYKTLMKQLFVFNNYWSKINIFYNNENIKQVKYKQINYYIKNFQLPYLYPILEIRKYYPKFSKFRDGIFVGKDNNILNYDFELNEKKEKLEVINLLINKNNNNGNIIHSEKCCLVKNTYHIKGELKLSKMNDNKNFELIFTSKIIENGMCNKKEKENNQINRETKRDLLCYGSVFECPPKESDRIIIIKSKDILFLLFRVYFHRISAIEIFTINNKSYYFNFHNFFDNNNIKKNPILNEFKLNGLFKDIKTKKEKLGLYNAKYEFYLFPLFKDDINIWDKKIKYLCNYDLII